MSKAVSITGITLFILAVGIVAWGMKFGFHRPYFNWNPKELAEYLVENQKPAEECMDLIWWQIMAPQAGEMKALCLYEYAKIAKNPTACELILPSSYGQQCLYSVAEKIRNGEGCLGWEETINCSLDLVVPNQGIEDCGVYKDREVRDWCRQERTATLEGAYECDQLESDSAILKDECIRQHALKLESAAECQNITNDDLQKACELQVEYIDY